MTDRKTHWENIYASSTPQQLGWYQKETALSLQLIRNTELALDAPIIDVGGGASVLVHKLCEQGYSNIGVLDVSTKALALAKARFTDKTCGVEWYQADVTCFSPPQRFALWHDRAVFHFLTNQSDRQKYVNVLKQTLEPDGHLIIMAFAIGGPQKCSGHDIVQYDVKRLAAELGRGFQLLESGHEVHITPALVEQKFAYFRYQRISCD